MYDSPETLERFLKEFADDDTTALLDGPDIATCKGYDGSSHQFLSAEGVQTCSSCKETVCSQYGGADW
jgi:hypothetical protein